MIDRPLLLVGRILAAVAAAGSLGLAVWIAAPRAGWLDAEILPAPVSASLLIENFACRRGETRTVIRRGVEDGYAPGNFEPARPDRAGSQRVAGVGLRDYDDADLDQDFFDYFEPPRDAVSGLFVIRMFENGSSVNDGIVIGDHVTLRSSRAPDQQHVFQTNVWSLRSDPRWSNSGDVYSIDIADLRLQNGTSLLDHIRDADMSGIVDVVIADDTAVDFMALAICSPPVTQSGLSFWYEPQGHDPSSGPVVRATCYPGEDVAAFCNPFVGNTPCGTELPIACFRPTNARSPDFEAIGLPRHSVRDWTGGDFALTTPVPANRFANRGDADAYCRAEFGEEWRVADWHLNGRGFDFFATGPADYEGRVWIDIRDQPYATCWRGE
ncbi:MULTISPECIES: hypothetical protein [Hyphobacterium]|uniref:Uncharacterized protein n=1 Tax=Hyphobacterium vulgare TaxID=1736751 RepID=A0ABV7A0Y4_9PROT